MAHIELGQTDTEVEGLSVCVRVLYGEQVEHLLDNFTALRHPLISPGGSLPKVKKISEILKSTKHTHSCTHSLSLVHTLQSFLPRNTYGTCETHNPRVHVHTAMRLSSNFSTISLLCWNDYLNNKKYKKHYNAYIKNTTKTAFSWPHCRCQQMSLNESLKSHRHETVVEAIWRYIFRYVFIFITQPLFLLLYFWPSFLNSDFSHKINLGVWQHCFNRARNTSSQTIANLNLSHITELTIVGMWKQKWAQLKCQLPFQ